MATGEVLVFTMPDPTKASALADELRRDAAVRTAVVLERTQQGELRVRDADVPAGSGSATWGGGLIGALVGVLAGPLGILLGWGVGMLSGSLVDDQRAQDDKDGLAVLSRGIAPGTTVVMAEVLVAEFPAEARAQEFGARVARVPADVVQAEIASAEQAAAAAQQAAHDQRKAARKAEFHDHMHHLFHHSDDSSGAGGQVPAS